MGEAATRKELIPERDTPLRGGEGLCLDLEQAWGPKHVMSRLGLGDQGITTGQVRSEEPTEGLRGRPAMSHGEDFSLSSREKSIGAGVFGGVFRQRDRASSWGQGVCLPSPHKTRFPSLMVMPPPPGG